MNGETFKKMLNEAWLIKQFNTMQDIEYTSDGGWEGTYRSGKKSYNVYVEDDKVFKNDVCECEEWQMFGVCRHTLALRMYKNFSVSYSDAESVVSQRNQKKDSKYTQAFFASMDRLVLSENQKYERDEKVDFPLLEVMFQLVQLPFKDYAYYRYVENKLFLVRLVIRQSEGKFYQVKDLYEFFELFNHGGECQITSKIHMYIYKDLFSNDQQRFIRWLMNMCQNNDFIDSRELQRLTRKEILILPTYLRELLKKFGDYQLEFRTEYGGKKYKYEPLKYGGGPDEKFLDYQLFVDQSNTYVALLENQSPVKRVNEYYQTVIHDDRIYFLNKNQMSIYQHLYRFYEKNGNDLVGYSEHTIEDFFSEQLPLLEQIAEVKIDDSLREKVTYHSLELAFYLKQTADYMVELEIDYQYGKICYSNAASRKNEPNQNEVIVIRNRSKERNIRYLISNLGFIYQPEGFYLKYHRSNEAWYQFFSEELSQLNKIGKVVLDESLKELLVDQEAVIPKLEVVKTGGLLDISFKIDGISIQDVEKVLHALSMQQPYTKLEDGSFLLFSDEHFKANESLQKFRELSDEPSLHFQSPLYRGAQLAALDDKYVDINQEFREFVQHLTHPAVYPVRFPEGLQAKLRPYQVEGFRWMKLLSYYHLGGILADEMGLGKTIQTIAYLLSEKEEQKELQALIVVPASLIYNWIQEFQKYAPNICVQVINGAKKDRIRQINSVADVYVTSYQSFRQDEKLYTEKHLNVLILDEAQMVKNNQTKTFQALRQLEVSKKFALSGTPLENRLEDLWSIFQIVLPGYFPNKSKFRKLDTSFISQMIQPFVMRRTKKDVLIDLPERQEINYYNELTKEQKEIYLAQLEQIRETLIGMDSNEFRKQRINILAGLTRLRQICCSPLLYLNDYQGKSGKLEQFKELIVQAMENKRRVLVFSQFTSMLSILENVLKELGYPMYMLQGNTPSKKRMEMVNSFNNGERSIFLISLKAGGTGLNLTGANTVILYDLWWNPAVEDQATSRAHRMGQQEVVEVWRLITEGTIEEKIDELQKHKRELFDQVMQGEDTSLAQLTEEDIRELFSVGQEDSR